MRLPGEIMKRTVGITTVAAPEHIAHPIEKHKRNICTKLVLPSRIYSYGRLLRRLRPGQLAHNFGVGL